MDVEVLDQALLVGAAVLVVAILAVRVSGALGVPSLLAYLVLGVVLSAAGVSFDDPATAHALGFGALVIILAEGGLTTRWPKVRSAMPLGVLLATVGVGVSTIVVAVVFRAVFDTDWTTALLVGAIFASTDAAAVFSVLRKVPIVPRLAGALEAESGLNDAPTVLLVTLISTGAAVDAGLGRFVLLVAVELIGGALLGLLVGAAAAWLLRRLALPAPGLVPIAVVTGAVLAYGAASALHLSGFAAVYVAALVLGNAELPHGAATRSFVEGLGWMAQIGLFVMLGLLAWPLDLTWSLIGQAVVVGLASTLLARPIAVLASAAPFRVPWNEQAFIAVAGLRGAVPVVLATIPRSEGYPGSDRLFQVVFVAVVIFTLVQTPPLPWLARTLRVVPATLSRDLDLEAASLDRLHADVLDIVITEQSALHGVEIGELRLPPGVSVALLVRHGDALVPQRTTTVRHGDELLVVVPRELRAATEDRLQSVSRHGRLAGWVGVEDDVAEATRLTWRWGATERLLRLRRGRAVRRGQVSSSEYRLRRVRGPRPTSEAPGSR
jgi:cell volume regulation protein A